MDESLRKVTERLLAQTRSGKIVWEEASRLSTGDRFRVNFGDVVVEVGETEILRRLPEGGERYSDAKLVEVLNPHGFRVAQAILEEGNADYETLANLFDVAFASARKRDAVLDKLLQKLGA